MLARRTRKRPVRTGPRRGVSILEVLFAIMVTTIGLLGAIAVFPVASTQARKGRIADEVAVVGQSAIDDFAARYMRRPANWRAFVYQEIPANPPNPPTKIEAGTPINVSAGESYIIDPRMIARSFRNPANPSLGIVQGTNPSFAPLAYFPKDRLWGMKRATLWTSTTGPMIAPMADHIFQSGDDLVYNRPTSDRTLNAIQLFDGLDTTGKLESLPTSTTIYKRAFGGHLSWLATVTPKLELLGGGNNELYLLSIVVFYDRPTDYASDSLGFNERYVGVQFPGGGVGGGEVGLYSPTELHLTLKPNDWILLSGVKSGSQRIYQWYRILDVEPSAQLDSTTGRYLRYATLAGPDWDVSSTTIHDSSDAIQKDMQAVGIIMDGVVGVYEKTIRLDYSTDN